MGRRGGEKLELKLELLWHLLNLVFFQVIINFSAHVPSLSDVLFRYMSDLFYCIMLVNSEIHLNSCASLRKEP